MNRPCYTLSIRWSLPFRGWPTAVLPEVKYLSLRAARVAAKGLLSRDSRIEGVWLNRRGGKTETAVMVQRRAA